MDVRFVSATNRDPREAIKTKHLREDFYYRLNVVRITLPPLRERVEDIPILANHFLVQFWNRHHSSKDPLPRFGDAAMEFLMSRPWRGNVRELQNVVEHLVVFASPDTEIEIGHLPVDQDWARGSGAGESTMSVAPALLDNAYHLAKGTSWPTEEVRHAPCGALETCPVQPGCQCRSNTLYRLLQRHGFRRDMATHRLRSGRCQPTLIRLTTEREATSIRK